MNNQIKAVGFDLFNTLITVELSARRESLNRLTDALRASGLDVDRDPFVRAHGEAALRHLEQTRVDGRETHNRFWISTALNSLGHRVGPEDLRIGRAVEAYFSAYIEASHLIPETKEMLVALTGGYRLGLLSNFTHAPAAVEVIHRHGLTPYFDAVVISGEVGYRKPHPLVFQMLVDQLGVAKEEIAFVGDDAEADVSGADRAGLRPIWTTYVQERLMPPDSATVVRNTDEAKEGVPRISTWKDLLTLLGVEQR
ncbi:MAG TPA: HAD family hydrolase [Syntrophobacteria bacterium]|nr:HAD family hydrolase [Syntrophobacteria bacterium]